MEIICGTKTIINCASIYVNDGYDLQYRKNIYVDWIRDEVFMVVSGADLVNRETNEGYSNLDPLCYYLLLFSKVKSPVKAPKPSNNNWIPEKAIYNAKDIEKLRKVDWKYPFYHPLVFYAGLL